MQHKEHVKFYPETHFYWHAQGNYATVGSVIVAIAIVGRGGWAGLSVFRNSYISILQCYHEDDKMHLGLQPVLS